MTYQWYDFVRPYQRFLDIENRIDIYQVSQKNVTVRRGDSGHVRNETPPLPSCFKCSAVMSFGPAAGELLVRRIASTVSDELKGMKFLSSGFSLLTLRNDSLMFFDVLNGTAFAYCLQNSDAICFLFLVSISRFATLASRSFGARQTLFLFLSRTSRWTKV